MRTFLIIFGAIVPIISATMCRGSYEFNQAPGASECLPPVCNHELAELGVLFPSPDPAKFYVCEPGRSHHMNCGPGTCFSHQMQGCVHPWDWVNPCVGEDVNIAQ